MSRAEKEIEKIWAKIQKNKDALKWIEDNYAYYWGRTLKRIEKLHRQEGELFKRMRYWQSKL